MEKVCLIIDDKDQQHIFEAKIRDILARDGYEVNAVLINTTDPEVLNDEQNIDIEKLTEHIKRKINDGHIDVIAQDFNLSDDNINGLNVIEIIRQMGRKTPIVLYSGNREQVIRSIVCSPDPKDSKKFILKEISLLIENVKKLMLHNICDFVERTGYDQAVIKILREKETSTRQILLKKLREYPNMVFRSAYPRFEGESLSTIAKEIEKSTYQGQSFQEELIEQTVAYMLKTSEEE